MPKSDGYFKKGNDGRLKGSTNKYTKSVKEVVLYVFNKLQSDSKANLYDWAQKNPKDFYNIAAKLIQTEVKNEITGKDGVALPVLNITFQKD